jgi:hypothetical protein
MKCAQGHGRRPQPGDHLLCMSNGGFGGVHAKLLLRSCKDTTKTIAALVHQALAAFFVQI